MGFVTFQKKKDQSRGFLLPSLVAHCHIDFCYFGRSFPKVHKAMDKPVLILGYGHRVLYHNIYDATEIAKREYPNDPDAIKSAILHIEYDRICSNDQEFKRYIEYRARTNKGYRKKIKHVLKVKRKKKSVKRKRKKPEIWKILIGKKKRKKKESLLEIIKKM